MLSFPERLPEDVEAERALLATCGAMGAEQAAQETTFQLAEEDFVHPAHRAVFKAMKALVEAQIEINSLTLKDALDQAGNLSRVGGYTGLVELLSAEEVGRPQVLVDLLVRKRKQRQLIRLGAQIVSEAQVGDPSDVIAMAGSALSGLARTSQRSNTQHVSEFCDEHLADIDAQMSGTVTHGLQIPGFEGLNRMTSGFQPGNLVVLAARPGIGKTSIATNWVRRVLEIDKRCLFFTLEMSKRDLLQRLACDLAGVNFKVMIANKDRVAREKYAKALALVKGMPLHINDKAQITPAEIAAEVDRVITREGGLDLVVLDYLQLLTSNVTSSGRQQSEATRVGEMTRAMKLLAKDRGLPFILISQLNREVEHRQSGRPQLSDLRDSGCVEQDGDIVLFVHRKGEDIEGDLIIAKNRNGECGSIHMGWDGPLTRYTESVRYTDPAFSPAPRVHKDPEDFVA